MSDLRISGLTKTFDAHRALDGVSIEARDGELLTLLGPSGCGKSTTLWSIAGLHRPDAGTIGIGDDVVFDGGRGLHVPPERRECGVVFQSYAVWPHMTVAENVGYPLRLRRMRRPARARRVHEVLDLVELGDLADRYPHQLSGGQQQRVALARALSHPPRLLLLDEPFSNFDAKLRDRARVWLRALQREVGVTTVFVTHDQAEALSLSDRVAVLREGVVHQVDTPEAIYERPADLFVADFVGTVNLLDGTVVGAGRDGGGGGAGWVDVAVDGLAGPLRAATPPAPTTADSAAPVLTGPVTVAVRPEAIVVHDGDDGDGDGHGDGDDGDDGVVAVPVADGAYLGDHHLYRVRLGEALVTVRTTHPTAVVDGRIRIEIPAGRARAYPRREHAHG